LRTIIFHYFRDSAVMKGFKNCFERLGWMREELPVLLRPREPHLLFW